MPGAKSGFGMGRRDCGAQQLADQLGAASESGDHSPGRAVALQTQNQCRRTYMRKAPKSTGGRPPRPRNGTVSDFLKQREVENRPLAKISKKLTFIISF
jgi:hypothetical protein